MISHISDIHIGGDCDYRQMRLDAEMIRDTPHCYALLSGDYVDNHIKHRSAMVNGEMRPEKQYQLFEYFLKILGPKCIIVTSGNHDLWTVAQAGVDMIGRIARDNRVFYAPHEAWLDMTVGSQSYTIAIRHQYRYNSGFNQGHAVKQWLRLGTREFDVGCISHNHEAAIEQHLYRGQLRWVCRPGSYQITSGYSSQYGYNDSLPTCPTFLYNGSVKEIAGFPSLRSIKQAGSALRELGTV
jgi:predicted MPP superfamily phosphohydrolase